MSIFAIVILLILGIAVKGNYRYVGQAWKGVRNTTDPEHHFFPNTPESASKTIFTVVGIYTVFLGLSILCFLGQAARRKIAPASAKR